MKNRHKLILVFISLLIIVHLVGSATIQYVIKFKLEKLQTIDKNTPEYGSLIWEILSIKLIWEWGILICALIFSIILQIVYAKRNNIEGKFGFRIITILILIYLILKICYNLLVHYL